MFCVKCGREYREKCVCLSRNEISRAETYLLYGFVLFLPATLFGILLKRVELDFSIFNYLFAGSISLGIIVTLLLIAYYPFKKNYLVLFFGCHQKSSRSLHIRKHYFVLCARCTGIMIGIFLTVLLSLTTLGIYWYFLLGIPLIVDGVMQKKTDYVSTNAKRMITGILFAPTLIVVFSLCQLLLLKIALQITTIF